MNPFYTGIGSRETPGQSLVQMFVLAMLLEVEGFTLRSGGAAGADASFYGGATLHGRLRQDQAHIYFPWPHFTDKVPAHMTRASIAAYKLASTVHPKWESLKDGAKALHARNCHQVLGDDLTTPSAFVVCWTPDGCESERERTKETGGTATAIVLADRHGIPVFNIQREGRLKELLLHLEL